MNVVMSSVNYSMADIELREKISFTKSEIIKIYNSIKTNSDVLGTVIISTCNRTEIYMSLADGVNLNPLKLVCDYAGINYELYKNVYITVSGDDVIWYLSELACGIKSLIWGEDQIITQVKNALDFARENNAADSITEVMFRQAISAAKRVRTVVALRDRGDNAAGRAVSLIKKKLINPSVLVIGNGMAGREAAEQLVRNNIDTTITLRQYKHGENIVPCGVKTINYGLRYSILEKCDAVISATSSPHYTLEYSQILELKNKPVLFIDLAVPRDIDEKISSIRGIEYFNIDDISKDETDKLHDKQYDEIRSIIQRYVDDFYRWYEYKRNMVNGIEG